MSTWRPGQGHVFKGTGPPLHWRAKLTSQQRSDIVRRWQEARESGTPPVKWVFCKEMAQEYGVSAFTINRLL